MTSTIAKNEIKTTQQSLMELLKLRKHVETMAFIADDALNKMDMVFEEEHIRLTAFLESLPVHNEDIKTASKDTMGCTTEA